MKIMYAEVHMSDEQSEKLKKWEKETGKDAEDLVEELLLDFINKLSY